MFEWGGWPSGRVLKNVVRQPDEASGGAPTRCGGPHAPAADALLRLCVGYTVGFPEDGRRDVEPQSLREPGILTSPFFKLPGSSAA